MVFEHVCGLKVSKALGLTGAASPSAAGQDSRLFAARFQCGLVEGPLYCSMKSDNLRLRVRIVSQETGFFTQSTSTPVQRCSGRGSLCTDAPPSAVLILRGELFLFLGSLLGSFTLLPLLLDAIGDQLGYTAGVIVGEAVIKA